MYTQPFIEALESIEPDLGKAPGNKVQIAYLLSLYPARSITFVLNEIIGLRELGVDIVTASINPCDSSTLDKEVDERDEEARTFYVKTAGFWRCLWAVLSTVFFEPIGLARGLLYTIRLGESPIRFFYFLEALIVGTWMRQNSRNHLHIHFGGAVASVGMLVARTFPVKLSMTIHGPDEFWDSRRFYLRQKIETASFVCCISSYGKSQLMLHTPPEQWDKLIVCRLGVNLAKFSPAPSRIRNSADPAEIVCVGRLVAAKGQHILLRAVRDLVAEGRNVRLRLIGYGPQLNNLEAAAAEFGIEDQVVFEGSATSTRVIEALRNASIFCLPSFAEGIPVALMEAMAMQVPCISTSIAGIPELIRHGANGLLVSPADENELTDALRCLLDDPDLSRRLAITGRERVQELYDLQESLIGLKEIFLCRQ